MSGWNVKKHIGLCLGLLLLPALAYFLVRVVNWTVNQTRQDKSIGIIGGADGPTMIFITSSNPGVNYAILIPVLAIVILTALYWPIKRIFGKKSRGK